MMEKLLFLFLILSIYLNQNGVKSVKMKYMDVIKTFETLVSLDRLKYFNTTLCGIHLTEYASSLKSEQYWAMQSKHIYYGLTNYVLLTISYFLVFDSNPKILYSLLMGNRKFLGNYDECLQVEHPDHLFTGQHCMISVNIIVDIDETTPMKTEIDLKQVFEVIIIVFSFNLFY